MADPSYKRTKEVTSANVSTLSTYELRQELELRGKMDLVEGTINHKSLLQRLVQELVAHESSIEQAKVDADAARLHEQRDAEKALREQRKAEALERSRQRQADPSYFAKRAELNKEGKEQLELARKDESPAAEGREIASETEVEKVQSDDPFRITKSKGNKVFVR